VPSFVSDDEYMRGNCYIILSSFLVLQSVLLMCVYDDVCSKP